MSVFDLSAVVSQLSNTSLTISRRTATYDANGIASLGAAATSSVRASVQPITGKVLQKVPENLRLEGSVVVHTNSALQTAKESTTGYGDRFTWRNATYEVQTAIDWAEHGNFYRYVASKVVD